MRDNVLRDKSFEFAVRIVNLCGYLQTKGEYVLSKQVLRSGTSIGANIREGEYSVSKADFAHKMSIAQKEMNETIYWLDLLYTTNYISKEEYDSIINDATEVFKILNASMSTVKRR